MSEKPGLVAALIAAQRNFKAAIADSVNPHFRSHYVDLLGAWDACKEALWDQGLTVEQYTRVTATGTVLVTRLDHVSGESREGEYPLVPAKDRDPQALGAAMTYARRYCLMAMVGLAPEDDDGNKASEKPKAVAQKPANDVPKEPEADPGKLLDLSNRLTALGLKTTETRLGWVSEKLGRKVTDPGALRKLPASDLDKLFKAADAEAGKS